jgi:hypothetical protein
VSLTPATVKLRLPEFAAVADATIQFWLDSCAQELNPDRWGSKYDEGHLFLTAHTMVRAGALSGGSGSSQPTGPVSSTTVGPVSRSYAVSSGGSSGVDDLELTSYGQIFKRKRNTLPRTPLVM